MNKLPGQKQFRINTKGPISFRSEVAGTTGNTVEGHAAVFSVMSEPLWELGGAREMLLPGCFAAALARQDDCKLLINHDASLLLARNLSGTLTLREDVVGLWFSATLPDTSYANDLKESMRRGDISQCSFAFCIDDASLEIVAGEPVQMIRSVSLSDVSVVTYPAYPQTDASLRSQYQELIAALRTQQAAENPSDINTKAEDESLGTVGNAAMDSSVTHNQNRKREIELFGIE
jgi:HK97 family phage prohead protease